MKKGHSKWFLAKMVLLFTAMLGLGTACPSPITPPVVPSNLNPKVKITRNLKENGTAHYEISASDNDGYVTGIKYNVNGQEYSSEGDSVNITKAIVEGRNTIYAIAYDNEGASSFAEDTFTCPSDAEGTFVIANAAGDALKGTNPTHGLALGDDNIPVDVLVKMPDGRDGVINYQTNTGNGGIFELYGIPYLDIPNKTSTENLQNYVIEFLRSESRGLESKIK